MKNAISFFDIDETLFHTFANIKVIKSGEIVKVLNNQEFNTYQLKYGEHFDFSEFQNSDVFFKTSIPIDKTIKRVRKLIASIKNHNLNDKVIFLTARSDFDDKEKFLNTFRQHNIDVDIPNVYVERSGNLTYIKDVSERKKKVIMKYLNTNKYQTVRMFDDDLKNLLTFKEMSKNMPEYNFYPLLVMKDGTTKII